MLPDFRPMAEDDLDRVMAIEALIYTHPWTHGNFSDTLRYGGRGWVMELAGVITGYAVLAWGAGEGHLLNLSIAAPWQRRGYGQRLLQFVIERTRELKLTALFLEVRASNAAGRGLYAQSGFTQIGVRRDYYPAQAGREDAIVLQYLP